MFLCVGQDALFASIADRVLINRKMLNQSIGVCYNKQRMYMAQKPM